MTLVASIPPQFREILFMDEKVLALPAPKRRKFAGTGQARVLTEDDFIAIVAATAASKAKKVKEKTAVESEGKSAKAEAPKKRGRPRKRAESSDESSADSDSASGSDDDDGDDAPVVVVREGRKRRAFLIIEAGQLIASALFAGSFPCRSQVTTWC